MLRHCEESNVCDEGVSAVGAIHSIELRTSTTGTNISWFYEVTWHDGYIKNINTCGQHSDIIWHRIMTVTTRAWY